MFLQYLTWSRLLHFQLVICANWKLLLPQMNHDFIPNLKFLMSPFLICLSLILCIHFGNVFPHFLMDVLQVFCKILSFSTAYFSFIYLPQFRCISWTTSIYNLEW